MVDRKRKQSNALAASLLDTAAQTVDTARDLLRWNSSVFARLGWVAEELRQTAMGFKPKKGEPS